LVFAGCLLAAAAAQAETPRVAFDMPFVVAGRDVTPAEFAADHPGQKLIEARFEISSLLGAGQERDLTQYFVRIENPERSLTVVDYLPKTLHESRMAGPVTVTDSKEKNASLGINFSGKYELITAVGPTAGIGVKNTSCVKYELLPPLESVAASGTLLRGSAVFFKLKATPRNPLEGAREYGLVLQVPASWRTDYVQVRCTAEGMQRSLVSTFDEEVTCGKRDFVVALYLEGDEPARLSAEAFARRRAAPVQGSKAKGTGWTAWEMMRR
jgi:hypothetical protein